jgi:serine protease
MESIKKVLVSTCLVLVACGPGMDSGSNQAPELASTQKLLKVADAIDGEYIVVLRKDGAAALDVTATAGSFVARFGVSTFHVYEHALKGFAIRADAAQALAIAADPAVAYVEQNGRVQLNGLQAGATWGIDRIDQRTGLDSKYWYGTTAANVHAYIIDTGIYAAHSDFEGRASADYDSVNDGQNGNDCNGHGTHVAGTVGGKVYGVAKKVRLHGVRVLSCGGSGSWAGVIAGVNWVTANRVQPAVANMSLGGGATQSLDDAVTASINAGVVYAVAAGNSNADASGFSPARTPAAVTVGATDNTDTRAWFSNYGQVLDIFAPGVNVTSAWIGNPNATNTISGTSMASPHVAGAAALLLAKGVAAAAVPAALVANSTANLVANPGAGSPNRMLFTGVDATAIANNAPVGNLGGAAGSVKNFSIDVPAGLAKVTFTISGGTGDADLYVRFDNAPEQFSYDCRPLRAGNGEVCTMFAPAEGRWFAQLRGFAAYAGVTLSASY